MKSTFDVDLKERSYPIVIGVRSADAVSEILPRVRSKKAFIVTDDTVAPLYLNPLKSRLEAAGVAVHCVVVPAGENSKSFAVLESVIEELLAHGCDRHAFLIALGGGVVGDLTGFAASVTLRGIDFIQMPTTLLAGVDSSVGGKTAVNAKAGKNLVGTFYQPKAVLIDETALKTLPKRQMLAGYAEVVKYGFIADGGFFGYLEENAAKLVDADADVCRAVIEKCCRIKADIVAADERETSGVRALLNLGHTFGHALEAAHGYDGSMLHGEGVALGMILAARLSVSETGLCADVPARMTAHFKKIGLPVGLPRAYDVDALMCTMLSDKKTLDGKLNLVLLKKLGTAVVAHGVDARKVESVWRDALLEGDC